MTSQPDIDISVPCLTTGSRARQFRSVLEVHGVGVVPAATPDLAVPLEDRHQRQRHLVAVRDTRLPFLEAAPMAVHERASPRASVKREMSMGRV